MARRKISDNKQEEIEYRLLELIRKARAYGDMESRVRYMAIRDLAELWGVVLASHLEFSDKVKLTPKAPRNYEPKIEPSPSAEEKDLTPNPSGGILDELGWGDKDGNEKN